MTDRKYSTHASLTAYDENSKRIVCPMLDAYLAMNVKKIGEYGGQTYISTRSTFESDFKDYSITSTQQEETEAKTFNITNLLGLLCKKSFKGKANFSERVIYGTDNKPLEYRATINFDTFEPL